MKQNRQSKIVAILALCVSVVGLTLGFAAFSNTLTISSSATVSPNESDFNINVYGIGDWNGNLGYAALTDFTSSSISIPQIGFEGKYLAQSATNAKITDNGKTITISDINVGFSGPGQIASYYFMIKNEGQYDAYVDLTELENTLDIPKGGVCTPGPEATPELVRNACYDISLQNTLTASNGEYLSGGQVVRLAKDDYLTLDMHIDYSEASGTNRADGDFTVAFDDLTLEFTSVPPAE